MRKRSIKNDRTRMYIAVHPGRVLRWYLPEDMTIGEAARRLGVNRQRLSAILNQRAGISADMALRLSLALGTSTEMWLSMQRTYELRKARRSAHLMKELRKIQAFWSPKAKEKGILTERKLQNYLKE
ncbi:MAG TPA: HigA family addiction module antitoxin [Patescibacteria group bacterium]|nr:HigA family addiction module antitoxin [Patescibacteria group bacterium]